MGRSDTPPDISQGRLLNCSKDECLHYWKWFRKLGGRRGSLRRSRVKQFLQRSELSEEILEAILNFALGDFNESADFEVFCVACRLVAHSQELGAVDVAKVGDVPTNAPWFSEEVFQTEQAVVRDADEFDFEAVALGVNAPSGALGSFSSTEHVALCQVYLLELRRSSQMLDATELATQVPTTPFGDHDY